MWNDTERAQHRQQYRSHQIVFVDDWRRAQATKLSFFVHNMLSKRMSVNTIIQLVKVQFDRDLTDREIWRLDSMVMSGKQPPRRGEDPFYSTDDDSSVMAGYDNS